MKIEEITSVAIGCGLQVHKDLGPGLLESAYETVLAHVIEKRGLACARQVIIPISYDGLIIEQGFKADIIVERSLVIELKSVERLSPVHNKQLLTYLRFLNLPVGLLMNFSSEKYTDGLKRIVNNHTDTSGSKLNIHK
jgi:GxxExxY protein